MKTIKLIAVHFFLLSGVLCLSVSGQGTFQNLNFEAASVSGDSPGQLIPISAGLPGWNGYLTDTSTSVTTPQTQVVYDGISTGGAFISIIDQNEPGVQPLQGSYSVFLFGGGAPSVIAASISQTGLIPVGTQTLLMDAYTANASPVVAIDGQTISMLPVQTFPNYIEYDGNISSFAGQTATLSFTDPPPTSMAPSQFLLDDIQFSPVATPEPSTWALIVMGGMTFGVQQWRKRNKITPT
jgi:hypothetical protein